jgi:5-methylcytosine-specific restriction endonuclease McrA
METSTDAPDSLEVIRQELGAYKRAYCAEHIAHAVAHYVEFRSKTRRRVLPIGMTRREYQRLYQIERHDALSAYKRAYYLEHRERLYERQKAYERANPERKHAIRHNRSARKKKNGGTFTGAQWRALCDWFGNVCLCCGVSSLLTIDHVVPVAKGGVNSIDNLQPLCGRCNARKCAKTTDYRDPTLLSAFLASLRN